MTARAAAATLLAAACVLGTTAGATAGHDDPAPEFLVRPAEDGAYEISARFRVAAAAELVRAVLTDYDEIARFMPGVRESRVLERGPGRARVAQEAVSKYMLFSKRVFLVLEIVEGSEIIRFADSSGRSFKRYTGLWSITPDEAGTQVGYQLAAEPSFSVPGFVLRKLLDRDARAMIDGLRAEIAARTTRTTAGSLTPTAR